MARLREAEGDDAAALGLLEEAERVYVGDFSPNVQPGRGHPGQGARRRRRGARGAGVGAQRRPVRRPTSCPTCASTST